jgi:mannose-6-phosphate isomerase-like protein (cupin superfamily)
VGIAITPREILPWSNIAHEFIGADHGDVKLTFLLVEAPPGQGPRLHKHPYDEVMIVLDGRGTVHDGTESRDVQTGDIVVIPAGQPDAFVNTGDSPLRQVDIPPRRGSRPSGLRDGRSASSPVGVSCSWSRSAGPPETRKARGCGPFGRQAAAVVPSPSAIAGAGFEPATFGL